jgi:hypothetical protein
VNTALRKAKSRLAADGTSARTAENAAPPSRRRLNGARLCSRLYVPLGMPVLRTQLTAAGKLAVDIERLWEESEVELRAVRRRALEFYGRSG